MLLPVFPPAAAWQLSRLVDEPSGAGVVRLCPDVVACGYFDHDPGVNSVGSYPGCISGRRGVVHDAGSDKYALAPDINCGTDQHAPLHEGITAVVCSFRRGFSHGRVVLEAFLHGSGPLRRRVTAKVLASGARGHVSLSVRVGADGCHASCPPRGSDQASAALGSCVRWGSCSSPFWCAASLRPQPPGSSATEMTEMAETIRR